VEVSLFTPFYADTSDYSWSRSPLNARNNINGIGEVKGTEALSLNDPRLLAVQEAMVRKIVTELREFDNLYYEICNEPYFGGVTMGWQDRINDVIVEAEKALPHHHLISRNVANGSAKIENPHAAVSIFNFH